MTTQTSVFPLKLYEPLIELPTSLGDLDLHNFADFRRLTFISDGTLCLEWVALEPDRVLFAKKPMAIAAASVVFHQVDRLTVTPRDPEVPRDEDRALDHFIVEQAEEGVCRLRFVFAGGTQIDVTARSMSVVVEEKR